MPKPDQHQDSPNAKSANKAQKVEAFGVKWKRMDELVFIFAGLATLGGAVLGIIGVFAGFRDYRTLALWIGFFVCLCVLTSIFCYVQKRIWESPKIEVAQQPIQPSIEPKRPELSVDSTDISLQPSQPPRIWVTFTNRGDATAHDFKINGFSLGRDSHKMGPIENIGGVEHEAFPEIARGGSVTQVIDIAPALHPLSWKAIHEGRSTFFFYFEGSYSDVNGTQYGPIKKCYKFDPELRKLIIAPSDNWPHANSIQKPEKLDPKDRPEISIDQIRLGLNPNNAMQVGVQLTNRGNIAAHQFTAQHWCFFRGAEEAGQRVTTPPPSPTTNKAPVISPQATYTAYLSFPHLKPVTWESVIKGNSEMFLLLKISYTDPQSVHTFSFDRCYRYSTNTRQLMIADADLWPEGFNLDT